MDPSLPNEGSLTILRVAVELGYIFSDGRGAISCKFSKALLEKTLGRILQQIYHLLGRFLV